MIKNQPMDRLVCGDVGFGKTEVALRATFIALSSNKQVAVLTPTTLLAEQHYQTFQDRFSKYGIVIRELSRFKLGKDIKETISGIEEGKVDIVIGTHRLISNDHNFKNLGLIIIDEEHRFGVRQKEKFKDLKSEIDTLTLTATPIPRTLALSMEGIREFSVIATAPQKRLAIKTVVRHENKITVQEALTRELRRGGQAYVLHNDVKSIENKKELLKKLIPEARIAIAHGQMPEKQLEQVMRKFNQKQFNVLLCTTIIETGIDIPSANTIVIYRADKFGLAQLHQLRGRVGRSHHQAYAYLLTPEENSLTTNAVKRLEAIQSMEELGSGFFLALHDLEIRGAGQVLGDQQSGNISEIGFSLYSEMLESAILSIKNNEKSNGSYDISLRTPIEVNVFLPALLPETYCPDVNERLIIYKRLANTKKNQEIDIIEDELIDRFGSIPRETKSLLITHKFRQKANHTGIKKLDITKEGFIILFDNNPQIKIDKLLELINSRKEYRLLSQNKIRIQLPEDSLENQLQIFDKFLQAVS